MFFASHGPGETEVMLGLWALMRWSSSVPRNLLIQFWKCGLTSLSFWRSFCFKEFLFLSCLASSGKA